MTPADAAARGPIHAMDAFLAERLCAIFPAGRFQHELLAAPLTEATLSRLASVRTPFVGRALMAADPVANAGRQARMTLRWGLYLVTSNPRDAARLLGDMLAPGLAQMAHAAIVGLHGWTIGGAGDDGLGTLAIQKGEVIDGALWREADRACWAQVIECPATFLLPPDSSFRSLASTWTFDGQATAATDTIPLEGR